MKSLLHFGNLLFNQKNFMKIILTQYFFKKTHTYPGIIQFNRTQMHSMTILKFLSRTARLDLNFEEIFQLFLFISKLSSFSILNYVKMFLLLFVFFRIKNTRINEATMSSFFPMFFRLLFRGKQS